MNIQETPQTSSASAVMPCWANDDGSVQLYHADCLDVLPFLHGVDAVISDPPYGISWDTKESRFAGGTRESKDWIPIEGDDKDFDPRHLLDFKFVVLFGYPYFAKYLPIGNTLIWDKRHINGKSWLSDAEIAWCKSRYKKLGAHSGGYGCHIFQKTWQGFVRSEPGSKIHPTQKPVTVMAWCMDKAKVPNGATVLDPYMGSGSTGIACIRSGRNFIGIEKEKTHFENAKKRIQKELQQGRLW
jgi:site-specific DNA-methyltransferase (adenine-specific)